MDQNRGPLRCPFTSPTEFFPVRFIKKKLFLRRNLRLPRGRINTSVLAALTTEILQGIGHEPK
jgi:hypothetical protein